MTRTLHEQWQDKIERILVSEDEIAARVRELGARISRDYAGQRIGDELICVGILKGAVPFLADLTRAITVPVTFDFIAASSYGVATEHSGVVRILKDLEHDIRDRDVLIVEDIIDSGLTLHYLYRNLEARKPRSLRVAALLDKPERRKVAVDIDYKGFEIPDAFVVGYGLDWNERGRNLPFVAALKPEVYGG
ncbi:MAG TPA: hypoxanthine phosphoribosyltransferase [Bacillota bacterium]